MARKHISNTTGPLTVRDFRATSRRTEVTVDLGSRSVDVWTESNVPVDTTATPWLPTLTVTMSDHDIDTHWPADTEVDGDALDGAGRALDLLTTWYPDAHGGRHVGVRRRAGVPTPEHRGVACFFSGGVDSFYSTLRNLDEITHVVLVHGLDISLDNTELWDETVRRTAIAARDLDKELILVRTNIRKLHHKFGPNWQHRAHGAFLAHIALVLAPHVHRVYIPASKDDSRLVPYGTHPELDPLWSSSDVDIVHDGTDRRLRKLELLAESAPAMAHLRVCWWNLSTDYNCGRCEKCLRTMIGLDILSALDRCSTLPHRIDPREVRRMYLTAGGDGGRIYAGENLEDLQARGAGDSEIAHALSFALHRGRIRNALVTARFVRQIISGILGHWCRNAFHWARYGTAHGEPLADGPPST